MSAECYWCIDSKPAYGNQMGTKGDPFACCHRCHVFCCGHHGQRDNGAQKFYCFDCDKTILLVSAIKAANLQPQEETDIAARSTRISLIDLTLEYLYQSFEDFIKRNPGYADVLQDVDESHIDFTNWDDPVLKNIFKKFPPVARKMLVAVAIMVTDTDTTEELTTLGDPLLLHLKTSIRVPQRN